LSCFDIRKKVAIEELIEGLERFEKKYLSIVRTRTNY